MKQMKRLIALLLASVLILSLAACGGKAEETPSAETAQTQKEATPEKEAMPEKEATPEKEAAPAPAEAAPAPAEAARILLCSEIGTDEDNDDAKYRCDLYSSYLPARLEGIDKDSDYDYGFDYSLDYTSETGSVSYYVNLNGYLFDGDNNEEAALDDLQWEIDFYKNLGYQAGEISSFSGDGYTVYYVSFDQDKDEEWYDYADSRIEAFVLFDEFISLDLELSIYAVLDLHPDESDPDYNTDFLPADFEEEVKAQFMTFLNSLLMERTEVEE